MSSSMTSHKRALPRQTDSSTIKVRDGRIMVAARPQTGPRSWLLKLAAALTGAILAAFVAIHMVGNIKAYFGPAHFNDYAHWLRVAGEPLLPEMGLLWAFRVVLLISIIIHIAATLALTFRSRSARGPHRARGLRAESWVSRTMLITGIALLGFIIIHILDLTTGHLNGAFQAPTHTSSFAYENLIASFSRPLFSLLYLIAMGALAVHLIHGLWLLATDFAVTGPRTRRVWKIIAYAAGIVIALVNMSVPIAVLTGVLS